MKSKLLLVAGLLLSIASAWAQAPQQMNYQAVVRDNTGAVVANLTPVVLRFTIHDGTGTGTAVFTETQTTQTNKLGLVNIQIGSDSDLSVVNWGSGAKYLEVEANINNAGFITMGTSQLISVPYALYSNNSGSSVAGPTGAQGVAGANGGTGAQGLQGATGSQGV